MPPASQPFAPRPSSDPSHMLPAHQEHSKIGPTVGIVIILVLVLFGALYFWGAYLNKKNSVEQLPFIPEENSTQQAG